jgi:photosystem II stability/assembly factor-like uncharacterized protein
MNLPWTRPPAISILASALFFCSAMATSTLAQNSSWQPLGPAGGNVISLVASATQVVYLGTADGHVFASSDAGGHWALRGHISGRSDAVIQKLLVDKRQENSLLAAVWFQDVTAGGGLYRSSDAGATWTIAGLPGEILRAVAQAPNAPDIFVAGTRSGLFRSTDNALTWQRISPAGDPELRNVDSVAIDPRDPQIIYAGTYHLPWKTSDAGKSWNAVAAGMIDDSDVMSLSIDAGSPTRLFASACSGIYRSENAGAQWTKLQGIPYSSRRTQAIVQDPRDSRIVYAATTEGLWLTRDGGESWARTTPRDWVVNDIVVLAPEHASAPSEILLGTEAQGVLTSADGGVTFSPANQSFHHRITAALVSDSRDAQHLLAWLPDSPDSLIESRDAGTNWNHLPNRSPAKLPEIARLFSSDSGWWIGGSDGALSFYDSASSKWTEVRFISVPPRTAARPRSAAHSQRLPATRASFPAKLPAPPQSVSDLYDVRTIGARVYVATPQALWSGTLGERILRPVTSASHPPDGMSGDAALRVWMAAAGKILFTEDAGKTWRDAAAAISPEIDGRDLRWVRAVPFVSASGIRSATPGAQDATILLAATTKGLYRRAQDSTSWQLVQSGLPSSEPIAYFFAAQEWAVALRGGGLYVSQDASQTWARVDTGTDAGLFTGVAVTADGSLLAASLTEGLLRIPPNKIL